LELCHNAKQRLEKNAATGKKLHRCEHFPAWQTLAVIFQQMGEYIV